MKLCVKKKLQYSVEHTRGHVTTGLVFHEINITMKRVLREMLSPSINIRIEVHCFRFHFEIKSNGQRVNLWEAHYTAVPSFSVNAQRGKQNMKIPSAVYQIQSTFICVYCRRIKCQISTQIYQISIYIMWHNVVPLSSSTRWYHRLYSPLSRSETLYLVFSSLFIVT